MAFRQKITKRYPHHQGGCRDVKGEGLLDVAKDIGLTVVKKSVSTVAEKSGQKLGNLIFEHLTGGKKVHVDPDKKFRDTIEELLQLPSA